MYKCMCKAIFMLMLNNKIQLLEEANSKETQVLMLNKAHKYTTVVFT